MIVDMNALIGRWPFCRLGYEGAEDVLRLMDAAGIDRAVLTSLDSIFHYDVRDGNRDVGNACRGHPDRFIPFALVNPCLPGWRRELTECIETFAVRGVKVHPDFHKFSLTAGPSDGPFDGFLAEMESMRLPVYVQSSLLDQRHYPGYCFVEETPLHELERMLDTHRGCTFIIGGGRWFGSVAQELAAYSARMGMSHFFIATDGIGGPWDGLEKLVESLGSDRLLFSSRTPILYSEAGISMVRAARISGEDGKRVLGGNAAALLGL